MKVYYCRSCVYCGRSTSTLCVYCHKYKKPCRYVDICRERVDISKEEIKYIDAGKLIHVLDKYRRNIGEYNEDAVIFSLDMVKDAIHGMEAADVIDNIKGIWRADSRCFLNAPQNVNYTCSYCRNQYHRMTPYCPNCGADLRSEHEIIKEREKLSRGE